MKTFRSVALVMIALALGACATVPITGRRQLSLVSSSSMLTMSAQQYEEFLQANPPSRDRAATAMVGRVGRNIARAVEKYMTHKGMSDRLKGYKWEFNLVENKAANAWCMPGGKVVVYTGILPHTLDERGLAVVMGHEIAHAVADHGAERLSQGMLAQLGGLALSEAMKQRPQQTKQLWMTAYGVGAQFGALLPFSRLQESEADELGLIFMALAGYDPQVAVEFWQRMSQGKGGAPPELLSTHPSDETRIRDIQSKLPEARTYLKKRRG